MKKYFALYMMPVASIEKMMADISPEKRKASMDEWMQWMKRHEKDIAEMGAPLGKNKRLTISGISDVRNEVTGYSIIQAESHEAAAQIFKDNPHLKMPGAYIDILDVAVMPDMK